MKPVLRMMVAVLALVLALPDGAWAQRRGSHHHRTVFVGSAFYIGSPYWYPYPGPYYYGPAFVATEMPPTVYIERFDGTPTADAGEIYCPSLDQHYPDIQDCPNGWQRVFRAAENADHGG